MAVLLLLLSVFSTGAIAAPAGSESVIDFEAVDLDGQTYRGGEELRGQVVLLDFWATWCGPCVKAIPKLNELRDEFREKGFEVVGLASYSGTLDDVREFLSHKAPRYPIVVVDDDLPERFSVIGYPTYFLVDRQGRIAETYVGEIESQLDGVRSRIRELLAR